MTFELGRGQEGYISPGEQCPLCGAMAEMTGKQVLNIDHMPGPGLG